MSHDLQAPLRAIQGFSTILTKNYTPQLEPKTQHYLQMIHQNTTQLKQLIDDLLSFSHLGRQTLQVDPVDTNALTRETLEMLAPEQEKKQIDVQIANLPHCKTDPILLQQVFTNLLSNALKFTQHRPETHIKVNILPNKNLPIYYVQNNKINFAMRYTDKLFTIFHRLHQTKKYGNTNIGLATMQHILTRHSRQI